MRGAVIVGALSFVGYHLLTKLLEEEIEVIGMDEESWDGLSRMNEEKLLLIGRNSCFSYCSLHEKDAFKQVHPEDVDTVFFCLFEPNQYSFSSKREYEGALTGALQYCSRYKKRFVFLSSVNASTARFHKMKGIEATSVTENGLFFYEMETLVEKCKLSYAVLQVPVVYGPWQPSFMTYHKLILSSILNRNIDIEVKENSEDSVYAGDVAQCLYDLGRQPVQGIYYMESGEAGQWQKGIELLNGNQKIRLSGKRNEKRMAQPYSYCPQLTLKEGLLQQANHIKKYKALYEKSKHIT